MVEMNRHGRRAASDGWRELKLKKRIEHQKLMESQRIAKQKRIMAVAAARRAEPREEIEAARRRKAEKATLANEANQKQRAAHHAKYQGKHVA